MFIYILKLKSKLIIQQVIVVQSYKQQGNVTEICPHMCRCLCVGKESVSPQLEKNTIITKKQNLWTKTKFHWYNNK